MWVAELRWLTAVLLSGLLLACSTSGPVIEPAPLSEFTARLAVDVRWTRHFHVAEHGHDMALRPWLAGDDVFINDIKGRVEDLNAESGKTRWQVKIDVPLSSGVGGDNGALLLGGHKGEVLAIDRQNGAVLWQSQVSSEILTPPQVAGNRVLLRTIDGRLHGLDRSTGQRVWVYQSSEPSLTLHGLSQPVVAGQMVIAGFANGKIVALDINDGGLLWEAVIASPQGRSELERLVDIDATPVVYDRSLYVAAYQGKLTALDLVSGRLLWSRDISTFRDLAVDEMAVYLTDDEGIVWAVDRHSGASLWQQPGLFARAVTSPVYYHGRLAVGDFEGYVHWLDREDGSFLARQRIDNSAVAMLASDAGDALYAVSHKGVLKKLAVTALTEK